jgi:hypothetical protein
MQWGKRRVVFQHDTMILNWAGFVRQLLASHFFLFFSEILLHLHREHVHVGTVKSRYFSRISFCAQPTLSIR